MKSIHVHYYAVLREKRGLSKETILTEVLTVREIFEQLKEKYKFPLSFHNVKVAVNDEFCDWEKALNNGDSVLFIPPVAGG